MLSRRCELNHTERPLRACQHLLFLKLRRFVLFKVCYNQTSQMNSHCQVHFEMFLSEPPTFSLESLIRGLFFLLNVMQITDFLFFFFGGGVNSAQRLSGNEI